jgi:hypothetical protein
MDAALAELVWRRAASACEYCQVPQTADELPFHVDHLPLRRLSPRRTALYT